MRRAVLTALRILCVAAVAAAAVDAPLPHPVPPALRCYVLDLSGSLFWGRQVMPDAVLRALEEDASRGPSDDRFALVGFAGIPALLSPPVPRAEFLDQLRRRRPGPDSLALESEARRRGLDPGRTRIEDALELALSLHQRPLPLQVVLLTDGLETSGDAARAAARLRRAGVPLVVIPIGPRLPPEVRITPGVAFDVEIDLAATLRAPATVRLLHDGRAIASREVQVRSDSLTRLVVPSLALEGPPDALLVTLTPARPEDDLCEENNRIRLEFTRDPPETRRILYLGQPGPHVLETRLSADPRYRVMREMEAGDAPFDGVVLDNTPWDRVPPALRSTLADWVTLRGTGLLVAGGPGSLASGGYSGRDEIEPLLPVWAAPDERLAIALVLDRSSSMGMSIDGRRAKIDAAREALARILPLLGTKDLLALLAFNETVDVLRPPGPPPPAAVFNTILRGVQPRLGTLLAPPLEKALSILSSPPSGSLDRGDAIPDRGIRHILLVTDGETQEAPDVLSDVGRLIRDAGISLTVIVTGRAPAREALASLLAAPDSTRRIDLEDWDQLPALVEEDVRRKKGWVTRGPIGIVAGAEGRLIEGLPSPPPLEAANRTTLRPDATPVYLGPRGLPILALRRAGAGRTAVLATSLDDPAWGASWSAWMPHAALLIDRLASFLLDRRGDATVDTDPSPSVDRIRVTVTLREGTEPSAPPSLVLRHLRPDGTRVDSALPQVSARRYEARIVAEAPGRHLLRVDLPSTEPDGSPAPVGVAVHTVPYAAEWLSVGRDLKSLATLASASGGILADTPERLESARPRGPGWGPAQSAWILAALLLLAADLLVSTFWLPVRIAPPSHAP